jgi:Amt family ammonium transporter
MKTIRTIIRTISPYWLACTFLTAIVVLAWNGAVMAQNQTTSIPQITEATPEALKQLQGTINTIWMMVASILVILMNAGFAMLETGFCRQKNTIDALSKKLVIFATATVAYWAIGFSLMFGSEGNTFWGSGGWLLRGSALATYNLQPLPAGLPLSVYFLFQVAVAVIVATIVSGAVAERMKFLPLLIFSIILVGIIYPIVGHWVWGNGWLSQLGFKDFAGSTALHNVGGWAALMGAGILGPRAGKYRDKRANAIPGHNLSITTLGCLLLWVGWLGLNPGFHLVADNQVPYIALNTNLAAAAGGITSAFTSWLKDKKLDLSMIINGILGGLVAISAGCNLVTDGQAGVIGAIAGVIVVYSVSLFDRLLKIDDPVGAISVHLVCGIWGTLALGIFVAGIPIVTQVLGIALVGSFTILLSTIVWYVLKATFGLRVTLEQEVNGLDLGES